jgi:hypothetical protein
VSDCPIPDFRLETRVHPFLPARVAVLAAFFVAASLHAQPVAGNVSPSELLANKDQLTNQPVTVEGTLSNSGTNYFTDLRVILKDHKDSSEGVLVQPWLPVEVPPNAKSGDTAAPTLSDYIGKKVVIKGVLTDGVVRKVGPTKVLRVDSARIVD